MQELHKLANYFVESTKGLWATDGSPNTLGGHLEKFGVENKVENRRRWREIVLTSELPNISGVILHKETLEQKTRAGKLFPKVLTEKNIYPIVKVDKGLKPYLDSDAHYVTSGLDELTLEILQEYYAQGARATKWRAAFPVDPQVKTDGNVEENIRILAEYANKVQEQNLVPIVEPEILYSGNHSIDDCYDLTKHILEKLFVEIQQKNINLRGLLLKTNMITPGKLLDSDDNAEEVAEATIQCFNESVPPDVTGIVLLSGGQEPPIATKRLNAIARSSQKTNLVISYSFSRALEMEGMKVWTRDIDNPESVTRAKKALNLRAKIVAAARRGEYNLGMEEEIEELLKSSSST